MIHVSLFSGIGGFELAAEWMGWRNLVSCDINEFGNKVREYYWPEGYCHKDVKTLTYETINSELSARFGPGWRDQDIILTGGFPCQPYSAAGKRKGKDDERHLWPEMLRVIREVKPTFIVGENVRGLINWNGGMVFDEVCADLEAHGYEVQPVLLAACAVGAPHRRDRIWFVAKKVNSDTPGDGLYDQPTQEYQERANPEQSGTRWQRTFEGLGDGEPTTDSDPTRCQDRTKQHRGKQASNGKGQHSFGRYSLGSTTDSDSDGQLPNHGDRKIDPSEGGQHALGDLEPSHGDGDAPDTKGRRSRQQLEEDKRRQNRRPDHDGKNGDATDTDAKRLEGSKWRFSNGQGPAFDSQPNYWQDFPTQSPVCGGDDGLPTQLDNITFSKWRNESIKAYGNAIVPQVAYEIFKIIEKIRTLNP